MTEQQVHPGIPPARDLQEVHFTVDSELLRELGERLVGRPYIALAELLKNSFDADATKVEIRILEDSIEVSDNGHGMTEEDFIHRWMRVGSPHKKADVYSPEMQRPLTGSKGVGRLAVQFLASGLELVSTPKETKLNDNDTPRELYAIVDWDAAVRVGNLTDAIALYDQSEPNAVYPNGVPHGTKVTLSKLKHEWTPQDFARLASEVWFLQAPFRSVTTTSDGPTNEFHVDLYSADSQSVSAFNTQMSRVLDLYSSRIVAKLVHRTKPGEASSYPVVTMALQLEHQDRHRHEFAVPIRGDRPCLIDRLDFEIRIFTLQYRQPYGISVHQAREYMNTWGGVHIYDAGFRIPYAGAAADWLNLEFDHSHRLAQSQLLPPQFNVADGLNYLPTNSRVFGVVNIDTAHEARTAPNRLPFADQHLQIQVSRDRLVANDAYGQLQDIVRFTLDFYSTRLAAARLAEKVTARKVLASRSLAADVWHVLEEHEQEIPKPVAHQLRNAIGKTIDAVREQSDWTKEQAGLLGAMATVGVTALAFDHQFGQQLSVLEHYASNLQRSVASHPEVKAAAQPILQQISQWVNSARSTRQIFSPITDERNRATTQRFKAQPLIADLAENLREILRGVTVDTSGIDPSLLLPQASFPAWMAIFHNVLINSHNAMIDSAQQSIAVRSYATDSKRGIRIQDTGVGVDLAKADGLFTPLHRELVISAERRALGYGGTGLGLAIVRMLATDLGIDVRFANPDPPFKTCFEMEWNEES